MSTILRVASIIPNDLANGPGVRTTIFLQGCNHHCRGCHNPDTWSVHGGTAMTIDDICNAVAKQAKLIRGVTFSGGEPLLQAGALWELILRLRSECHIEDIWLWTGYNNYRELNSAQQRVVDSVSCVVYGRFMLDLAKPNLAYRGSSNQVIMKKINGAFTDITAEEDRKLEK